MNTFVLIAGVLASLATIGHFTMGTKMYLKPFLSAELDPIVKNVMHSVFHYISVYMVFSSLFLVVIGIRGEKCLFDPTLILAFIGINYGLFALVQIIIGLTSRLPGALMKMFQWIFWILISLFVFLGK
ncbi:hypothetical protein DMA11_14380 [Marinilabiliaceae bacterium JC017]|nr:hypothetical protein DMA11_14380 [Marinilabiliaceae bacterium JC017]